MILVPEKHEVCQWCAILLWREETDAWKGGCVIAHLEDEAARLRRQVDAMQEAERRRRTLIDRARAQLGKANQVVERSEALLAGVNVVPLTELSGTPTPIPPQRGAYRPDLRARRAGGNQGDGLSR
jgi:hypothetical protein